MMEYMSILIFGLLLVNIRLHSTMPTQPERENDESTATTSTLQSNNSSEVEGLIKPGSNREGQSKQQKSNSSDSSPGSDNPNQTFLPKGQDLSGGAPSAAPHKPSSARMMDYDLAQQNKQIRQSNKRMMIGLYPRRTSNYLSPLYQNRDFINPMFAGNVVPYNSGQNPYFPGPLNQLNPSQQAGANSGGNQFPAQFFNPYLMQNPYRLPNGVLYPSPNQGIIYPSFNQNQNINPATTEKPTTASTSTTKSSSENQTNLGGQNPGIYFNPVYQGFPNQPYNPNPYIQGSQFNPYYPYNPVFPFPQFGSQGG